MLQQERMTVVDALVADIPTTDKGELRKYLYGLSNDELRKTAAAYQTVHSQVAADPRVIATQRQVLASAAKLWWSQLFRTVIDGRIAVDDQANRGMIERQI